MTPKVPLHPRSKKRQDHFHREHRWAWACACAYFFVWVLCLFLCINTMIIWYDCLGLCVNNSSHVITQQHCPDCIIIAFCSSELTTDLIQSDDDHNLNSSVPFWLLMFYARCPYSVFSFFSMAQLEMKVFQMFQWSHAVLYSLLVVSQYNFALMCIYI